MNIPTSHNSSGWHRSLKRYLKRIEIKLLVSLCFKLTNRFWQWSLRCNSLSRTFRVLFGIEGIFYLSYLLHSALASTTRSSSRSQRSWSARWNWSWFTQRSKIQFTKSSHSTAVLIIFEGLFKSLPNFNHQQWHPTCKLNLYSYWTILPKRGLAAKILKWESEWHHGHRREISQRFSQHPIAYLLTR